jgi:DNA-binding cell septation regulator SpoVG
MSPHFVRAAVALVLASVALPALATATAEEAARLCKELTCIGAEKGPSKDGSIPAWTGPSNFTEEQKKYTPGDLEKLRRNSPQEIEDLLKKQAGADSQKVLATITAQNLSQHADKLTEGQKGLFKAYPTYKMNVYKTIRTAYFPDEIYKATVANATTARLEGTDGVKDAKIGFPFPIPKSGAEPIWNHKLKFRGSAARRFNNQAIVKPDGSYTITKLTEDVKFKFANLADPPKPGAAPILAYYLSETISPPRVAGTITLVHETADQTVGGRAAWIYSPGLGRVARAPDVGYDNPAVGTDNEQYNDQIDVFNGSLDRYNWKLIGKQEKYIAYNSYLINSPKVKYKDIIRPLHINQDLARYELHRVWVIEATLRQGLRHNFAKRIFYVDEDSWSIAAVDCFDARGNLWKVQEAHLITAPFVPTVTGVPELIYDLQSKRYFTTAMVNEDAITDFKINFPDSYFDPSSLKRKARGK